MTDPVSKPKAFGDAALVEKVVESYAEGWVSLGVDRCRELGIEGELCHALWTVTVASSKYDLQVLEIDDEERIRLLAKGFSTEFVNALVRLDKKPVLEKRARWLFGKLQESHTHSYADGIIDELGEIGPPARAVVKDIVAFIKENPETISPESFRALSRIEPDVFSLAYYFSEICLDREGNLGDLMAGLMNRDAEVRTCSLRALEALQKTDVRIPQTGLPLLRQAYHRSGDEKEKELLVRLAGKIERVTEELLLFLEEVVGEAKNKKMENLTATAFYVLSEIGKAAIPPLLRLCKEKKCSLEEMIRFFTGTPLPEEYLLPYIEAIASRREFLKVENARGKTEILRPILQAGWFKNLDPLSLRPIFEGGDDAVRHVVLKIQSEINYFPPEGLLPLLLTALQSRDSGLAVFAASWMIGLSSPLFPRPRDYLVVVMKLFQGLIPLLDHPDTLVRFRATHVFSKMLGEERYRYPLYWLMKEGDEKTMTSLFLKLSLRLEDPLPEIRKSAAAALGFFGEGGKLALPLLVAMRLNDPDESCRLTAHRAMEAIEKEVL